MSEDPFNLGGDDGGTEDDDQNGQSPPAEASADTPADSADPVETSEDETGARTADPDDTAGTSTETQPGQTTERPDRDLDPGPDPASRDEPAGEATDDRDRYERAADAGRAITSDEVRGTTRYALPGTWDDLEDFFDFEVEPELRDRGIRDATDNEISDATKVVIQNHAEDVAEQVVNRRLERE